MAFLLCLYVALLIASLALTVSRKGMQARAALLASAIMLCAILLTDHSAAAHGEIDWAGFDDLALEIAVPLIGMALMALFVTRWRWLFWLVLALNVAIGAGIFSLAVLR